MAIGRNINGSGIPGLAATAITGTVGDGLAATGTNQATALLISNDTSVFSSVPSGSGCYLPPGSENDDYTIINNGVNSLNIYPPFGGGVINNGSPNTPVVLPAGQNIELKYQSATVINVVGGIGSLMAPTGSSLVGFIQNGTNSVARTAQSKLRDFVSVQDFISTSIDGITSNQSGIVAAVAYAASIGSKLYWPSGTYVSTANIPLFHTIRHFGSGVINRSGNLWYIDPSSKTVILYAAANGSTNNDGLSATEPLTVQSAFDSLSSWATQLMYDSTYRIQLAAGTYGAVNTVRGLRSRNRIDIRGPSVGGHPNVPTAIFDGTGSPSNTGMYFQFYMFLFMQDIKFINWSDTGVGAEQLSNLYVKNVHTNANAFNGIFIGINSKLYLEGGIHSNVTYCVNTYAGCDFTIGFNGSVSRPSFSTTGNAGEAGVYIGNNCNGHIDYCDFVNCIGSGGAVQIVNQSRVHFVSTTFTTNYYNVRCDGFSTFLDDGSNTFNPATSGKSIVQFSSIDTNSVNKVYYDVATTRWRWGLSTSISPRGTWDFYAASAGSMSYSGTPAMVIETAADTIVALGADGSHLAGHQYVKPGTAIDGQFVYAQSDGTFRMSRNGNVDSYRWGATGFSILVAGQGLLVKEGANAKQGSSVLVGGTVTVANTSVTANSRIFLTSNVDGGTPGFLRVSARIAGTSFTITSSNGADTSTVAWQIFEPA